MSSSGKLSPDALHRLAKALLALSNATVEHRVRFDAYMPMNVEVDDVVLRVNWDEGASTYVVDERFGD